MGRGAQLISLPSSGYRVATIAPENSWSQPRRGQHECDDVNMNYSVAAMSHDDVEATFCRAPQRSITLPSCGHTQI